MADDARLICILIDAMRKTVGPQIGPFADWQLYALATNVIGALRENGFLIIDRIPPATPDDGSK